MSGDHLEAKGLWRKQWGHSGTGASLHGRQDEGENLSHSAPCGCSRTDTHGLWAGKGGGETAESCGDEITPSSRLTCLVSQDALSSTRHAICFLQPEQIQINCSLQSPGSVLNLSKFSSVIYFTVPASPVNASKVAALSVSPRHIPWPKFSRAGFIPSLSSSWKEHWNATLGAECGMLPVHLRLVFPFFLARVPVWA